MGRQRKAQVPVGELVMYMPMEKPKDKGEIRNHVGIMFPMVAVENRLAVPVMEPRDYKARGFHIWRDVELAKYGFAEDSEGFRVAQSGTEAKPHSGGCRERIRHATKSDDVGQQRMLAAAATRADRMVTGTGHKS